MEEIYNYKQREKVCSFIEENQKGLNCLTGYALSILTDSEIEGRLKKILFKDENEFNVKSLSRELIKKEKIKEKIDLSDKDNIMVEIILEEGSFKIDLEDLKKERRKSS